MTSRALLIPAALVLVVAGLVLLHSTAPAEHEVVDVPTAVPAPATPETAAPAAAAPPAPLPDAATVVAAASTLLDAVRSSGPASEPWDDQGTALLDELARGAVGPVDRGCFVAGCAASFTFASRTEYEQRRAALERSSTWAAWTGGKRWSDVSPVPGGRVSVALVLYRPD